MDNKTHGLLNGLIVYLLIIVAVLITAAAVAVMLGLGGGI